MLEDQFKWDERYKDSRISPKESELLVQYLDLSKKGKALDIAAGSGRNSIYLHQQGFEVDAWDISTVGLALIKAREPGVNIHQTDLDDCQLANETYDLVINFNYLNRNLFPQIVESLKHEGILMFQTFIEGDQGRESKTPRRKAYYLRKNELLHAFLNLQIILYKEDYFTQDDKKERCIASLIARKI
ncbi:MAG: methyltransferase domain-containing protein [Proteobacteria bacterium]|nr:methyltransferase domain-containing protein [Pseudomonadota bacterium]